MDKVFVGGMIVKKPDNAPEWVLGKVSFKLKDFFEFAKQHQDNGWLNVDIKVSKNGKPYAELDTWKPERPQDAIVTTPDDDIPF